MRLDGKVAMVTGAAKGIGAAIVEACAREGARGAALAYCPSSNMFLGDGVRLFDQLDPMVELEATRVIESPSVTHLRYRVK